MRDSPSNAHDRGGEIVRQIVGLLPCFVLSALGFTRPFAPSQDTHESVDREMSQPLIRGGIIFKTYCVLCHGERGDCVARAAKLHVGVNLAIGPRPAGYYEKIIRNGGEAVGASSSMPPWNDELSVEQVADVIAFLVVLGDPVRRGEVVFKTNCVLCHGIRGDGKGRAAILFDPRPADLTRSNKGDVYKARIIRFGGEAVRRSSNMPAWDQRLTKTEIADLLTYLRTITIVPHAP
jgi:cytochrome c oxidase cbb3-type subunit III